MKTLFNTLGILITIIVVTSVWHGETSAGWYDYYVHKAIAVLPYITGCYVGMVVSSVHGIIKERL